MMNVTQLALLVLILSINCVQFSLCDERSRILVGPTQSSANINTNNRREFTDGKSTTSRPKRTTKRISNPIKQTFDTIEDTIRKNTEKFLVNERYVISSTFKPSSRQSSKATSRPSTSTQESFENDYDDDTRSKGTRRNQESNKNQESNRNQESIRNSQDRNEETNNKKKKNQETRRNQGTGTDDDEDTNHEIRTNNDKRKNQENRNESTQTDEDTGTNNNNKRKNQGTRTNRGSRDEETENDEEEERNTRRNQGIRTNRGSRDEETENDEEEERNTRRNQGTRNQNNRNSDTRNSGTRNQDTRNQDTRTQNTRDQNTRNQNTRNQETQSNRRNEAEPNHGTRRNQQTGNVHEDEEEERVQNTKRKNQETQPNRRNEAETNQGTRRQQTGNNQDEDDERVQNTRKNQGTQSNRRNEANQGIRRQQNEEDMRASTRRQETRTTDPPSFWKPKYEEIGYKCGENVTLEGRTIELKSPEADGKYPPNVDCTWKIDSRQGQIIRIYIRTLHIEHDSGCKFDYLEIKGLKRLCGNLTNLEVIVNSSQAFIVFHSDNNDEAEGFRAIVVAESVECSSRLMVASQATLTSPKYPENYPDSTDCWTLITAREKSATLTLTFEMLQLEPDQKCAYDFLEIFDSHLADQSLGKFCELPSNQSKAQLSLRSSQNVLLLHFHSDQLLNSKGYRIKIMSNNNGRISDCEWHANWQNKTLYSPKYPSNYPSNANCEIELEAPSKQHKVVIYFDWLQMEVDANCTNDRLEIWDLDMNNATTGTTNKKPTRILCGTKLQPFKFVSSGYRLRLKFISDDFAEFPGFLSRFAFVGPDQKLDYTKRFGRIPQNSSVTLGSSHALYCEPEPKDVNNNNPITWFKDDHQITEGVSSDGTYLIIREFSSSSAGRYICKYNQWTREAWLRPNENKKCSILFRKKPKDQILTEGEYSILECHVISNQTVNLRWEKNDKIVTNTSRIQQLQNGFLFINGARKNDSGVYFCVAQVNKECVARIAVSVSVSVRINVNEVCGQPEISQPKDNGKIVEGTEAERGAFPWHVMFWDWKRRAFCGGALLNERWIATAAHCFETGQESSIEVRLGKHDQSLTEDSEVVTKIAEIIRHPDFTKETFDNDIALVKINHHVQFTSYVQPVCLPFNKREVENHFFGRSIDNNELRIGHVTGWGQLKENGPQPRYLQELRLPIVEDQKCRSSTAFKVTGNMFCAGYGKEVVGDACKGDSGGPFVSQYKSRWTLIGVVSWGEGCGRVGKYGFYTRVSNYLDWINAIIKL